MQARSSKPHPLRACAVLAAAVLGSGCAQDPASYERVDAGSSAFVVRGTATGLLGPVGLALRLEGGLEPLAVTHEGGFAFDTLLEPGASYTVLLADSDTPCALRNQSGVIAGADATVELTCTGASLASVLVSGVAPAVTLVPGTTEYVIDLPLSQQSITLTATVATPGDTLAIAGAPAVSGAPSAELALDLGDNPVDIVVENPSGWQRSYRLILRRAAQLAQYAYGKASNAGDGDFLGTSVALSGDTLAVGAYREDSAARGVGADQDDDGAQNSGAVYVFRRAGATWQQEAYLKASNTGADDQFGASLALSGDVLAVGAFLENSAARGVGGDQDDDQAPNSGAVYVFRRTGTTWQQEAYVKASNTGADDHFGASLALSGDTLAVGAWGEDSGAQGVDGDQDDNSVRGSGAVYVFRRRSTTWQQEAYVKASNTDVDDELGASVALSGDILAVGARGDDSAPGERAGQDDDSGWFSGAVHVYRRRGATWRHEARLKASSPDAYDNFGSSVALSGDTLAVGAWGEDSAAQGVGGDPDDDSVTASGAVYVFRSAGTAWQQEAYIKATNSGANDNFGVSVALSGDLLAVGAAGESSAARGVDGHQGDDTASGSGAVYLFRRTGTAWEQQAYVKASNAGRGDNFGSSVALSGDTLAAGAYLEDGAAPGADVSEDDDSLPSSGAVYVFH